MVEQRMGVVEEAGQMVGFVVVVNVVESSVTKTSHWVSLEVVAEVVIQEYLGQVVGEELGHGWESEEQTLSFHPGTEEGHQNEKEVEEVHREAF